MDRRLLALIAASGMLLAAPAMSGAAARDAETLLAQSERGTLTADGIAAGGDTGSLSEEAKPAGAGGASSGSASSGGSSSGAQDAAGAAADALPLTGSDPRITVLFGIAAVLLGAGLRMRTADARDY